MPGYCEYRFDGQRLGAVMAGTVTVKGPDLSGEASAKTGDREDQRQFLGGAGICVSPGS
jgi:hypothetical protein